MSDKYEEKGAHRQVDSLGCAVGEDGHCLTCSDELLEVRVLCIDEQARLALVSVQDVTEEIDISLVDAVTPGDHLLVHGGVAIARTG